MKTTIKKLKTRDSCTKESKYSLDDKKLCKFCFLYLFEKKIKRFTRQSGFFEPNQTILAIEPVSEYFLKNVIKLPSTIITKTFKELKIDLKEGLDLKNLDESTNLKDLQAKYHISRIVVPFTQDQEIPEFLDLFFKTKKTNLKNSNIVKLFLPVPESALINYCKIRNIKYAKFNKSELNNLLDEFELNYPGTKNSLMRSSEALRNII